MFLYSLSRPDDTLSSSDQRENPEPPTGPQQPRASVTPTSCCNTNPTNPSFVNKSQSSAGCYNHDSKCSVNSGASKSPFREYSRPKSVRLNTNVACGKQKLYLYQQSEISLDRNHLEKEATPFSTRTNLKSKVSWV